MKKELGKTKARLLSIVMLLCGATIYAVSYRAFIEPSRLILGGATGVATLLSYLFSLPVGMGILLVNLPLVLWGWYRHGASAVLHAALGISASSVMLEVFAFVPPPAIASAYGALLGGVFSAVGIALLLWYGFTTGGTELAAVLIRERFSRLAVGKIILLIDTAIVLLSVVLMKRIEALIYSVLLNVSFAVVLDLFLAVKMPKEE